MLHEFNFSYRAPTLIRFGNNTIPLLSEMVSENQKILVMYGGGSIKSNGVFDAVKAALRNHRYLEFGGVEANPEYHTLLRAIQMVKESKIDLILAVGGGSVIDAAKFVAAASLYQGEGWDLLDGSADVEQALPVGVVLTTAATGSETNTISVISDRDRSLKLAFESELVVPQFAIMDPDVLSSLPERQLVNGVSDAFVHCCEQYLTYPVGATIQDGYAEAVMRTLVDLARNLDRAGTSGWNQNMMWAANQALSGILGLGVPVDFASHTICRSLTVYWGIDHARTLSIVQPALLEESIQEKSGKLVMLGKNVFDMPDPRPEDVITRIKKFYSDLGMPLTLREAGVEDSEAAIRIMDNLDMEGVSSLGENGIFDKKRIQRIVHAIA